VGESEREREREARDREVISDREDERTVSEREVIKDERLHHFIIVPERCPVTTGPESPCAPPPIALLAVMIYSAC
jgi:hypothetical protein